MNDKEKMQKCERILHRLSPESSSIFESRVPDYMKEMVGYQTDMLAIDLISDTYFRKDSSLIAVKPDVYIFVLGDRLREENERDAAKTLIEVFNMVLAQFAKHKEKELEYRGDGVGMFDHAILKHSEREGVLRRAMQTPITLAILANVNSKGVSALDEATKDGKEFLDWYSGILDKRCLDKEGTAPQKFTGLRRSSRALVDNPKLVTSVCKRLSKRMTDIKKMERTDDWFLSIKYFLMGFVAAYLAKYKTYFDS